MNRNDRLKAWQALKRKGKRLTYAELCRDTRQSMAELRRDGVDLSNCTVGSVAWLRCGLESRRFHSSTDDD